MSDLKNQGERVAVDPSEFRREWHNYARLMVGIAATCLIGLAGSLFVNAKWQARTEERLNFQGERIIYHDKQIDTINTFQAQINGRLGVIEERTSNTIDGIKRIENKLEKK